MYVICTYKAEWHINLLFPGSCGTVSSAEVQCGICPERNGRFGEKEHS